MDYSRFRFKAVVDWIEIEIGTAKATNFPTVQDRLKKILRLPKGKNPYINAIDEGAGGSATIFRLRIHDPESWQEITETLRKLAESHSFAKAPKVTAIEIAFDAYSKGEATTDELAELVANYYRNMARPVSDNRRLYKDYEGSAQSMLIKPLSLVRHLKEGWQIGIGDTTDDLYQHAYVKTTDNGKTLSVNEQCARLEIRLQNAQISNQAFDKWDCYSFTSLSDFFRFRKPKDDLDLFEQLYLDASSQIGERKKRNRGKGGGTRLYRKNTRADTMLNNKAYDALRNLADRWKRY